MKLPIHTVGPQQLPISWSHIPNKAVRREPSVGDDTVRRPYRSSLTTPDLQRLMNALFETGLTVKAGTPQASVRGGPYAKSRHAVCGVTRQVRSKRLTSAKKSSSQLSCFSTFPDATFSLAQAKNPGATDAQVLKICKVKAPTTEQTGAYEYFLRHDSNKHMREYLALIYKAKGWNWDGVAPVQGETIVECLL